MNRRNIIIILIAFFLIDAVVLSWFFMRANEEPLMPALTISKNQSSMIITSSAFRQGDPIPSKYTCDGENISPSLAWSGSPENAKSLVLIMDDPDAPSGTFTHWLAWNLPSNFSFQEGTLPDEVVQGKNGAGKAAYTGPCPPSGTHRYFFKLYALDTELDLAPGADRTALEQAIEGHVLEQAELMGTYARS